MDTHDKKLNTGIVGVGLVILIGVVALASAFSGAFLERNYQQSLNLGATITTTTLSNTINEFRTQMNTNVTNLNTEVEAVSSTIHAYGTIVSENVPLATNKGGTATTTLPSDGQFLNANGTTPTWKTLVGTAGISISTSSTSTVISTTGFDATANIAFTGNNTHAGTETFSSSTTFSATTTITGAATAPYLAPVGAIEMYSSSTAPNGWLLCNGASYTTSTYPALWSLIGYQYGGSSSNFNVPNLQGRTVFGATSTAPFSATLGTLGGASTTIVAPTITPNQQVGSGSGGVYGFNSGAPQSTNATTTPIMPPYMILNYIIKY